MDRINSGGPSQVRVQEILPFHLGDTSSWPEAPALCSILFSLLTYPPPALFTQGLIFLALTNETQIHLPDGFVIGLKIPMKGSPLKSLVKVSDVFLPLLPLHPRHFFPLPRTVRHFFIVG